MVSPPRRRSTWQRRTDTKTWPRLSNRPMFPAHAVPSCDATSLAMLLSLSLSITITHKHLGPSRMLRRPLSLHCRKRDRRTITQTAIFTVLPRDRCRSRLFRHSSYLMCCRSRCSVATLWTIVHRVPACACSSPHSACQEGITLLLLALPRACTSALFFLFFFRSSADLSFSLLPLSSPR